MTLMPSRFSRVLRLTASVNHCTLRYLMPAKWRVANIMTASTAIPPAVTAVHSMEEWEILMSPQTAMIGALMTACSPLAMKFCTWVTSLVERVMRLAAVKRLMSSTERDCTVSNSIRRMFLPARADTLASTNPAAKDTSRLPKARMSISVPFCMTISEWLRTIWSVISPMYSGIFRSIQTSIRMRTTAAAMSVMPRLPSILAITVLTQPISDYLQR